jgi:hypothetical protein
LKGEIIPLSEVVELAIADGHIHGLVLREVWQLEFVLLLLLFLVLFLLIWGILVVVEEGA